jgi:hypothetical protein
MATTYKTGKKNERAKHQWKAHQRKTLNNGQNISVAIKTQAINKEKNTRN